MDKLDNVTNSTSADEEVVEVNEYSHDTVYYSIHLIHSSGPAMDPPALNVSETGVVPEEDGGGKFAVSLPCTGKATAEVDFLLEVNAEDKEGRSRFSGQSAKTRKPIDLNSQIKFTFDGPTERSETLNFKRRKVCLASASSILEKAASVPKQDYEDEKNKNGRGTEHDDDEHETGGEDDNDDDKGPSRLDPSSTTIVALGAAAGTIALLFILLTVTDPERQAKRQNGYNNFAVHVRHEEEAVAEDRVHVIALVRTARIHDAPQAPRGLPTSLASATAAIGARRPRR